MSEADAHHPSREQLEAFFHGALPEEERQAIEDHVANCDLCCEVLRQTPHDAFVERIHAACSPLTELIQGPTPTVATVSLDIPSQLRDHPRYRLIRRLGAGGMGVVYQAEHRLMERPVALKVIHKRLVNSDIAVERFRLEVKAAARLSHRNIVAAYDAEQADDLHFLVMEYIDGVSLSEIVRKRGPLSVLHACNFAMQAAQGMQHAHEQGMVHRDIKPQNMMRTTRGVIKILDFGLARLATKEETGEEGLTEDFATLGTPDYIAPEQAHDSKRADIRSDIYSLGCTLYYLLAAQAPFPDGTSLDKVIAHSERQPTSLTELRPDLPAEVAAIVARMMDKDPADRFQTPAEVVAALRPFGIPDAEPTPEEPRSAVAPTTPSSPPKPSVPQPLAAQTIKPPAKPSPSVRSSPRVPGNGSWRWIVLLAGGCLVVVVAVILAVSSGESADTNPVTQPPPSPIAQDGQPWVNLLPQLDLSADVVAGDWSMTGDGLHVDAFDGARLMIPYQPAREYDFEVTFTRLSGTQSIALHFLDGDGNATFDIDGWGENLVGIQNVDGQTMNANRTGVSRHELTNGETYTALLRVRRDRVDAYLNGDLMHSYRGDGSNLSMLDLWRMPRPTLGIGAYDSETIFRQIRIRNISN
ncbi:serine/threonine-protein kinase [Blastopirellula marina]|uniref:non-specific serine/threonine protein kinase n=1 Tax=Blastopirellula marina TaxID=124 RepID=A0A2S8GI26_9BACT|nr:serine/threonine-protein kinase [Blastopirellula marina]PQO44103.1 hypothetical protein C5Y93_21445 [Blastopirellula marina]